METVAANPVHDRIRQEIDRFPVVLFMKGTPVFPQCGFSAAVVQALTLIGVKFKGIDVLPQQGANVYDILRRDTLVLTTGAIEKLVERLK